MTETQRRIRAYKRALPHMKERVIAVALLLAMSVSMMSSATFAWITLSTNPEASSLATTIVANGNLEIALSDTDGEEPDETAVGDGGKAVALSNLSWGNLINLSDTSYSLDKLVLRPAKLDTKNLLDSPINAVNYGVDGRVTNHATEFAYTSYDAQAGTYIVPIKLDEDGNEVTDEDGNKVNTIKYGVRAVSSVTYEDIEGKEHLANQMNLIDTYFTEAQGLFQSIYQSNMYMPTVAYLVGVHVSYVLGDEDVLVDSMQVRKLKSIADVFYNSMYNAGCVIVELINLYELLEVEDLSEYKAYTFDDVFNVNNINTTLLDEYDEKIPAITSYRNTWTKTVQFYNSVLEASNKSQVYWAADLMNHVNLLCDMDSATLNGVTATQMAADMVSYAVDIIRADATSHVAVLNGGALVDADQLLDGDFYVASGRITISVVVPESIKDKVGATLGGLVPDVLALQPTISTSAEPPALLVTDYQTAANAASGGTKLKGAATAADTYAMAIDFWVRTNVDNSLLILEGEIQPDGSYGGVNRVWTELDDPNTDAGALIYQSGGVSTTQGSGSCYVFYADSPEQQNQGLNMLRYMRVAFVSAAGELLANANMDVDNAVKESGRVIVPLMLGEQVAVELDDGTEVTRYIQALTQNTPTRITAIIYLDGSELSNSAVLDSGTLKGQLNIQFGTTNLNMNPQKDENLMKEYYTLVFNDGGDTMYDNPENDTIELRLSITGSQPSTIKGNFLSIINDSQGARQDEFEMKQGDDGYWRATIKFDNPGNFELRSIKLDGVDIALTAENIVRVKIDGVAINSLLCDMWGTASTYTEQTTDSYYNQKIRLTVGSSDPHTIRGVFIGDNNQNVSVNFVHLGEGVYEGTATFGSSGTYTMTYLIVDDVATSLPEELHKTLYLKVGLKAYITIGEPVLISGQENTEILKDVTYDAKTGWSFVYSCEEALNMSINVMIVDDSDHPLTEWETLELRYEIPGTYGANVIDADVTLDPATSTYNGSFEGFKANGYYQFQFVKLDDDNSITVAAMAPTITSISPAVMAYREQSAYPELTYNLGGSRELKVTLENANVAQVDIQLTDGNGNNRVIKWSDNLIKRQTITTFDNKTVTTFTVPVPSDGQWTVTDAWVSMVFYNGKFYSGADLYDTDGVTVIGTDALSLKEQVIADGIGSYFLTEVDIKVNGAPSQDPYIKEFMQDIAVNDMTIAVNGKIYGVERPLATILTEVAAKFPNAGIDPTVQVGMAYKWDKNDLTSYGYSYSGGTLPTNEFGSTSLTLDPEKGVYAMGAMNFKLAGKYYGTFTLKIGGNDYTGSNIPDVLKSGAYVEVKWTQPEVKITAVTNATKDSTSNKTFSVNLASDNDYAGTNQVNRGMNGVQNYFEDHYANVYIMGEVGNYSVPSVTMQLSKAGNTGAATFTVSGSAKSVSYSFGTNGSTDTHEIGEEDDTNWYLGVTYSRTRYGTMKGSSLKLTYEGTTYTMSVPEVTIKQDDNPMYLQYTSDNDTLAVPTTVVSPDGRYYTFKLASVRPWTMEESDIQSEGEEQVSTETVYANESTYKYLGFITCYKYDAYTRTTTVTEGLTTTTKYAVTYGVTEWRIDGGTPAPGDSFTITGQHTAEAVIAESNRETISETTKRQRTTVIKDELSQKEFDSGRKRQTVVSPLYAYPDYYIKEEDLP